MPDATLFSAPPTATAASAGAEGAPGRYADTRESGIEGVGHLPRHWRITPLKYVASLNPDELAETTDPDHVIRYADIGNVTMLGGIETTEEYRFEDAPSRARRRVCDGDTIISTVRTYLRAVAQIDDPPPNLIVSTGFAVLRPRPGLHPSFLYRLLQAEEFVGRVVARSTGVSYPAIAPTTLARLEAWLPPLPEQEAIAAWLDERTRRIDELVAAKRRLIDLLAEQRTALITHAVIKGLNPTAPMKPSGIDVLGDVPRHWEVKRLAHLTAYGHRIMYGIVLPGPHFEGGVPIVKAGDVATPLRRAELRCTDPDIEAGYERSRLREGDVVYAIRGSIGACQHVPDDCAGVNITQDTAKIAPRKGVNGRWLLHTMRSAGVFASLEAGAVGATIRGINIRDLKRVKVPVPPPVEQDLIAAHLDDVAIRFDSLIAAAETAISRLTEYRQALISAAVTGKICVCDVTGVVSEAPAAEPYAELPIETRAIAGRIGTNVATRTANKHFQRSVLAAEIIARIGKDRTFGRVKLQKALILAEGHLQLAEIESQPVRAAAGPFDNAMMRSIQSQLQKSQWYEYIKDGKPLKFVPLAKAGGHKVYFDRYRGTKEAGFAALMALLARLDTRRSEIVATLYSAWNDFLIDGKSVTDDALVAEVLTRWDPAKMAIPEAKWRAALPWMRAQGLVPRGYGAHTRLASRERSKE